MTRNHSVEAIRTISLVILCASVSWGETERPDRVFKERTTDTALRGLQGKKAFANLETGPVGPLEDYDLMKMSEFISFGDDTTLVPRGAILHVPGPFSGNVTARPEGRLVLWHDFLPGNIARIATLEVTRDQAAGVADLDPVLLANAAQLGRIVVAVFNGSPTSVKRKSPEQESEPPPSP